MKAAKTGSFRAAWRHRQWRALLAGYTVSTIGDFISFVAIVVFLIDDTGSAGWVAASFIARMVASTAAGPIGGVLADRFDRRRLMVGLDLALGGAVVAASGTSVAFGVNAAAFVVSALLTLGVGDIGRGAPDVGDGERSPGIVRSMADGATAIRDVPGLGALMVFTVAVYFSFGIEQVVQVLIVSDRLGWEASGIAALTQLGAPIVARLGALGIFGEARPVALERMARRVRLVELPAVTTVFLEGDEPDDLYVITAGEVVVTSRAQGEIRRMGPDEWFGEIGLFRGVPRTATVTSVTAVELMALPGSVFVDALTLEERLPDPLARTMRYRLARTHPHLAEPAPDPG